MRLDVGTLPPPGMEEHQICCAAGLDVQQALIAARWGTGWARLLARTVQGWVAFSITRASHAGCPAEARAARGSSEAAPKAGKALIDAKPVEKEQPWYDGLGRKALQAE
jgi:hypothetical protein